jgi:hypothetical protein
MKKVSVDSLQFRSDPRMERVIAEQLAKAMW